MVERDWRVTTSDNIEQVMNSFLLAAAIMVLVLVTLIIWATILLFQVQGALERLERTLHPAISRDSDGRLSRERA